ncbi:hypothetical protein LCY76_06240 [Fictibacillus sp. KIGAM418]|uniref:Uncharacterized protein n=1 Tax=Fictibacillus marinisediminis TaxID=2878389 RepID=A0A9X1X9R8_9BACL|nr:hypothetical protein [Fictibacillus marinisediminis]MCK6256201.1 hypothetical protein [Fictibacillus marinisediminis]
MNKKLLSFFGGNSGASGKSEQIQNRESWLKVIVIGAFALLLFYKIATSPFVFRFSDFISLFASLFALTISVMYYKKFNDLVRRLEEGSIKRQRDAAPVTQAFSETVASRNDQQNLEAEETFLEGEMETPKEKMLKEEELPVDDKLAEDVQEEQAEEASEKDEPKEVTDELLEDAQSSSIDLPASEEGLVAKPSSHLLDDEEQDDDILELKKSDEDYSYEPNEEDMKTQRIKEEELKQIEMDKTQIYQQLYTRADLNEEERKYFQQQLQEKETQASNLKQELIQFTNKISQAINKTPQLFQKRDSRIEGIVRLLKPDFVNTASLSEINERLDELTINIPEETLESLQREGLLDESFHFTRSGYREAINTSKLI